MASQFPTISLYPITAIGVNQTLNPMAQAYGIRPLLGFASSCGLYVDAGVNRSTQLVLCRCRTFAPRSLRRPFGA